METMQDTATGTKPQSSPLTPPLVIDVLGSLIFGAGLVIWSDKLASFSGIEDHQIVFWLGWIVITFATIVGALVLRPKQRRMGAVKFLVMANAIWSIAVLLIVIVAPMDLNGWGQLGVGMTGVFTAVMGWWEYRLLK